MKSAFRPENGRWALGWPGRVAKHDLVYLSPPSDPMQGIPLGNGDVGVLAWCEDFKIIMAVNKCDLWEDAEFGQFINGDANEEEHSTTLRHAARIILDFNLPVFDLFYLEDFNARLNLAEATLELNASGPFGSVRMTMFVDHQSGLICCEVGKKFKESTPFEIILERFGSRTFSHWYHCINRDASIGLKGTASMADRDGVYLRHAFKGAAFAVGCRVLGPAGAGMQCKRKHSHAASIRFEGGRGQAVSFVIGATSPEKGDPLRTVKRKINVSGRKAVAGLLAAHRKAWRSFWMRSYMECGDDYLDNLWHLAMYYANASQRGRYPGRFINALWTWNRDVQPWAFYFHWNQQQVYWPLNAAGHHDLADSYLNYRFNALPHARKDARDCFGADGAFVSDVCERRGYNSIGEKHNHTPVAQIAMEFWRQYLYTCDKEFLKRKALPYMLDAARFLESRFEKGKDGFYHARPDSGYESGILLDDALPQVVYARVLFSAVIRALDEAGGEEPRGAKWLDILEHLAPLKLLRGGPELLAKQGRGWELKRGYFKGDTVPGNHILSAGYSSAEKKHLTSRVVNNAPTAWTGTTLEIIQALQRDERCLNPGDMKLQGKVNDAVEYSAVFPSGLLGLARAQSDEFKAAVTTAKLYAPEVMGWDPLPIALARLGLAEETWKILRGYPSRWQFYCNGFGHYGPRDIFMADAALRFRCNLVRDIAPDAREKIPFPAWPFRHMGMESMSVLSCAMNEALLQGHDGILRVAPAAGAGQNARFTLHAAGGFVVSAEIIKGRPAWIHIKSRSGNTCRVQNPWPKAFLFSGNKLVRITGKPVLEFKTARQGYYRIVPDRKTIKEWETVPAIFAVNPGSKTSSDGNASLGLPRMFAGAVREAGTTDYLQAFKVSRIMPPAGGLGSLEYPSAMEALGMQARTFRGPFADIHDDPGAQGSDGVIYFAAAIECRERMKLEILPGYDGPVKLWLDGRQVFHDPKGTNPATADKGRITVQAGKGKHEIMTALSLNHGKAWGIFLRFKQCGLNQELGIKILEAAHAK